MSSCGSKTSRNSKETAVTNLSHADVGHRSGKTITRAHKNPQELWDVEIFRKTFLEGDLWKSSTKNRLPQP